MHRAIKSDFAPRLNTARTARILKRWPRLTFDDIEVAGEDRTLLIFTIMGRYGIGWDAADRAFADWERRAG